MVYGCSKPLFNALTVFTGETRSDVVTPERSLLRNGTLVNVPEPLELRD